MNDTSVELSVDSIPDRNFEGKPISKAEYANLCELRSAYLQAKAVSDEAQRRRNAARESYVTLLRELHARCFPKSDNESPNPNPEKVFDIRFVPPRRTVVRVLAEDENAACELAGELFQTCLSVRKPDPKTRPVYAWRQNPPEGLFRATRVKAPKQLTRRSAVAAS
jgi:hypothetical protein